MAKGDVVIAVSRMIKTYILSNYKINSKKIFLNYRGVDTKEFPYLFKPKKIWIDKWNKDNPKTRNKLLLTLPGRVTRWKGQIDFLNIIKLLSDEYPNIHGIIVGDVAVNKKSFLKELIDEAIKLNIEDKTKIVSLVTKKNQTFIINIAPAKGANSLNKLALSMARAEVLRLYISHFNNRVTIKFDPKLSTNTINLVTGA